MSLQLYILEETRAFYSSRVAMTFAEKSVADRAEPKTMLTHRHPFTPACLKLNPAPALKPTDPVGIAPEPKHVTLFKQSENM